MKALLAILGMVAVVVVIFVIMLIGANNTANSYETKLEATWQDNQNVLSQYANKLAEAAQIPAQYKEDFKEIVKAEMEGRYGEPKDRKGTLANWVQERQLNYDSSLYTKLQAMIEAGRNEFKNAQTRLLDVKREYQTALGNIPGGMLMRFWGYPKVNLDKYQVVKTEGVIDTFNSGIEKPVQIFPKAN